MDGSSPPRLCRNRHRDDTRRAHVDPRDDVIVAVTSPESGTTSARDIVPQLIRRDLADLERSERSPSIEPRIVPIGSLVA